MDNGHLIMPYLQYNKPDRITLSGLLYDREASCEKESSESVVFDYLMRNLTMKNRIISNKS